MNKTQTPFHQTITLGIQTALAYIEEHNPPARFPYHNAHHTKQVMARTERILRAIAHFEPAVTERMIKLATLCAAWHDVVQGKGKGQNEKESIELLVSFMKQHNCFSEDDTQMASEAISATEPSFVNRTVVQKKVSRDSSIVAKALAMADIGATGMDGPEVFIADGVALAREEKKEFSLKNQLAFAQGRKRESDNELLWFEKKETQEALRKVFNRFDETIDVIEVNITKNSLSERFQL